VAHCSEVEVWWVFIIYSFLYNSDSGTALLCGNLSKKCVGIKCMSKQCGKCNPRETKDFCKVPTTDEVLYFVQTHEPCLCLQNYTGPHKGMEVKGAFKIVS
jgi:hypothetical protein